MIALVLQPWAITDHAHLFNWMLNSCVQLGTWKYLSNVQCLGRHLVSITDYCSSSDPSDTPVHGSILYQVYILLYSTTHSLCWMHFVFEKRRAHSLIRKSSFWVHVHELQWEEKMLSPCSALNYNMQLLLANKNKTFHIRKFCYTGQTATFRIRFWHSYKQQEVYCNCCKWSKTGWWEGLEWGYRWFPNVN